MDEEGPLAELLPELLGLVIGDTALSGYGPALVQVCWRWAALIKASGPWGPALAAALELTSEQAAEWQPRSSISPLPDEWRAKGPLWGAPLSIEQLAERGHEGLLVWADVGPRNPRGVLHGAARGGQGDLCLLAREWFLKSFPQAPKGRFGRRRRSESLEEWREEGFDMMLHGAAFGGHEILCRLAKEWGARHYDLMLTRAARGGHEAICQLAVEWASGLPIQEALSASTEDGCQWSYHLQWMLFEAAYNGHEHICRLAKEWNVAVWRSHHPDQTAENAFSASWAWMPETSANDMFAAAENGHENICRLAREWGGTNYGSMLVHAARGGYENLCRLARAWGATNFEQVLQYAVKNGITRLCLLAREWGLIGNIPRDANYNFECLVRAWTKEDREKKTA